MNSRMKAGVGLAAFLMLGLGGWTYWIRTPQYSLIQLSRAVQAKDRFAFEQYVDLDRTSKSFVEDLGQLFNAKMQQEISSDGNALGSALGTALVSSMIEGFKPAATSYLKQAVLGAVQAGSADSVFASTSGHGKGVEILAAVGLRNASRARFDGTGGVVRSGDIARVPLKFRYEDLDTTLAVTLGMERMGSRWRVTNVAGAGDYLMALEEVEKLRLDQVNAPIRKEIAKHVELATPIHAYTRTVPNGWFSVRRETAIQARIRNIDKKTVLAATFTVGAGGQQLRIATFPFAHIAPGEETVVKMSVPHESGPVHQALLRGDASDYAILPQAVVLEEPRGTRILMIHTSWQDYLDSLKEKGSTAKQ